MPALRTWPFLACLALAGAALFGGRNVADGSVAWLGIGALAVSLALFSLRGAPRGLGSLLPLLGVAGWSALSISWSTLPDRSWDYADRALVYFLFCLLGLWLAGQTRQLAAALAVLLGAVVVWSLLGKVLPPLYPDYGRLARLRGPVGGWNQLALLGDFALPLALWAALRRRVAGSLLAFGWLVALPLTGSRGGVAVGLVVVAAYLARSDERLDGLATLVAAGLPAAVVVAISFALPGITSSGQRSATRWHDGLVFGAMLVAGALAAGVLARAPRPRSGPALTRTLLAAGVLAGAVAVALAALKAGSAWREFTSSAAVGNSGGRFGSAGSNFRWVWWQQAWHGFEHHRLGGTGAGSFALTNLLYRRSYLDVTTEPHNLAVQFLSETGVVGLLLLAAAAAALLRGSRGRRGPELALALVLPAYLLHALVDIDWDYVAVSAPAFLVAGALVGRAATTERRASFFAVVAAAGAALAAFAILFLPWLGDRWSGAASAALARPAHAISLAKRARSVDPLLVDPLWTEALASAEKPSQAFAFYVEATRKQPANPETWQLAGLYARDEGCPRLAYTYLERFTELDRYAAPSEGADAYRAALKLVNEGKARC